MAAICGRFGAENGRKSERQQMLYDFIIIEWVFLKSLWNFDYMLKLSKVEFIWVPKMFAEVPKNSFWVSLSGTGGKLVIF